MESQNTLGSSVNMEPPNLSQCSTKDDVSKILSTIKSGEYGRVEYEQLFSKLNRLLVHLDELDLQKENTPEVEIIKQKVGTTMTEISVIFDKILGRSTSLPAPISHTPHLPMRPDMEPAARDIYRQMCNAVKKLSNESVSEADTLVLCEDLVGLSESLYGYYFVKSPEHVHKCMDERIKRHWVHVDELDTEDEQEERTQQIYAMIDKLVEQKAALAKSTGEPLHGGILDTLQDYHQAFLDMDTDLWMDLDLELDF